MGITRITVSAVALLLFGCVTINIYFPEAAAEEAADRIIDEVRGANGDGSPQAGGVPIRKALRLVAAGSAYVFDLLVAPAQAQANFDASSPASRALERSLKSRFGKIQPYLNSGAVGFSAAGLLEIRDRNAIPLNKRNVVRQLVDAQNTDWSALYAEIARINGHPEWIDQIRQVFAKRWVAKASKSWYYRDGGGNWKQK